MENKIQELTDKNLPRRRRERKRRGTESYRKSSGRSQENYRGCSQGSGFYRGYRS